ncbi:MAG: urea ABC transporter permease subunit UrtB [Pseudomonadota bacterium]
MFRKLLLTFAGLCCLWAVGASAQSSSPIQNLLQEQSALIEKSSRRTIGPAIDAIAQSGLPQAQAVLERWQAREMWLGRRGDFRGLYFFAEEIDRKTLRIIDIATGEAVAEEPKRSFKQMKPNGGIRAMIGAALVRFQLLDPDRERRIAALDAIERDAEASHLPAIRGAIDEEPDADIAARKQRLERLLTIRFAEADAERITAIQSFGSDLGVDLRATLNPLVATERQAVEGSAPEGIEIASVLIPGTDALPRDVAYQILVDARKAPPRIERAEKRAALLANIDGETVGGFPVAGMTTDAARDRAYDALADAGLVPTQPTEAEITAALAAHSFFERYTGAPGPVAVEALAALAAIDQAVALNQMADLTLDALSLASIYFLAAIGLAITFGVMGVINMAHGEFIMMGAYTGYVVQLFIPDYTLSIAVALPLAFLVTFGAGVAMERLVIRWLYHRPLETLLATFGISIALQQLAKNIFGTQARPLTAPDWLSGAWEINDVVSIANIRIAIFVLAIAFLILFWLIMNRTRLGLEVRAVTQNPAMAASMGINPDRINMLTFGLGSGIAGIAGVAIGLYAKVTSEMGQDYIVQSFMTVVVGGVGNIWGTLLGATMVGFLQKTIEWFNPSNTLAAQTYMILFIILFIQFRPRGIIALKGRAAEA